MDLEKKTYFIITGASRGIGKCMAIECCKKFKSGSVAVLIARSKEGLDLTKAEILDSTTGVVVKTYPIDVALTKAQHFDEIVGNSLIGYNVCDFDLAFIIHNVGSVGDVSKKAKVLNEVGDWENYFKLNVFSVISLNCVFMKVFAEQKKLVVNITSKCGIEPYASMAEYCSGKAAREMYFKVLAAEEESTAVLNYAPGPVKTEMTAYVETESCNSDLAGAFKQLRETNTILTTEQTTSKFMQVVEANNFKSGDHVDYYD